MKRLGLVALLALAVAVPATAGQVTVYQGLYQSGSGGEFAFKPSPPGFISTTGYAASTKDQGIAGSFQTFCIETTEFVSLGGTTYDATVGTSAIAGGAGGGSPDPVSKGTGYLYRLFAKGILGGYDYVTLAGRLASADLLQRTIWFLEDETATNPGGAFITAILGEFGTIAAAKLAGASAYSVYAVNLTKLGTGELAQDGLVFVPDGGATLMLLGCGLLGVGALRRKFRV